MKPLAKVDFSKLTRAEAESYVKSVFPDAHQHGHGYENHILSGKPYSTEVSYVLSPCVKIDWHWPKQDIEANEEYLWKVTAATLYEYQLSGRLTAEGIVRKENP